MTKSSSQTPAPPRHEETITDSRWFSLISAAANWQRTNQSETAVFKAFEQQIKSLGLQAAIASLDESHTLLTLTRVICTENQKELFSTLAHAFDISPIGHQINVSQAPTLAGVIQAGGCFFQDNTRLLYEALPEEMHLVIRTLSEQEENGPAICAPLAQKERITGLVYFAGSSLQKQDVPLFTLFTDLLAIALEHAAILESLQDQEEMLNKMAVEISEGNKTKAALHRAQKIESLAVLAGGVAHDFNNLLVGVIAQTSLALAKLQDGHTAVRHLHKALQAAERASLLTKQLLAYSGQGHFTIRTLNLNDVIQEELDVLNVALPSQTTLQTRLAQVLPPIEADPSQMEQLLLNLVLNGSEAIGEESGTITLTTGTRQITTQDKHYWQVTNYPLPPGEFVFLRVQDDGEGMDVNTVDRIFDPFFSTRFTGRGLGLAAVLGIVRGHECGLSVWSQPGKGTIFEIVFPVSFAGSQPKVPKKASPQTPGLVLVIDDEKPVRDAVADILAIEGVEVLKAIDGEAGLAKFRQYQDSIQLVLLDLSLPDMSGETVFSRLKEINPQARIVLSSGYSEDEVIKIFGEELSIFLQKPYAMEDLVAIVAENLILHQA